MIDFKTINIVGAGLSGLSAAITLARKGYSCNLISALPSERAQSVLAEGGINAALNTMGENDTTMEHFKDTMKGGLYLESYDAVRGLTENAPSVVADLVRLGVPFRSENGQIILRNFGGQKKKRTAYAKSSTGKMIMTALIDEARKYEVDGLIKRYPHHVFTKVGISDGILHSITVTDTFNNKNIIFKGNTIICTGGLNGIFPGLTTGTTQNTGNAAAILFDAGVELANLEFIQYHPTTVSISDKRMLISEAARGEGGRLYIMRDGKPWYFMEEKYPELKNLMPRDVISREMTLVRENPSCTGDVYLDMTGIEAFVWKEKLSDLRKEIIEYLFLDPAVEPVPVSPGIHFFMGGIRVNDRHETNVKGLYAAGEAACKYHGANRLGGNSMLGALYGGRVAAEAATAALDGKRDEETETADEVKKNTEEIDKAAYYEKNPKETNCDFTDYTSTPLYDERLKNILREGLGIVRDRESMVKAYDSIASMIEESGMSDIDISRARLGLAMVGLAIERKESRGAHYRIDYPDAKDEYKKTSVAKFEDGKIKLYFADIDDGDWVYDI